MDYRKKDCFECRFGNYTKIAESEVAVAWKVEEPEGTVGYEVWDERRYKWRTMPKDQEYGHYAFYSRDENDVRFWMREIERSGR